LHSWQPLQLVHLRAWMLSLGAETIFMTPWCPLQRTRLILSAPIPEANCLTCRSEHLSCMYEQQAMLTAELDACTVTHCCKGSQHIRQADTQQLVSSCHTCHHRRWWELTNATVAWSLARTPQSPIELPGLGPTRRHSAASTRDDFKATSTAAFSICLLFGWNCRVHLLR
jgi:hypothetical protein